MKMFFAKISCLVLCLLMMTGSALALNNTRDNLETAGFEPVDRSAYSEFYTLLSIPGYDYPVLAFESAEDRTQFRIYGKIGKTEGYYPVSVEVADDGERFVITVTDTEPAKSDRRMLAKLNVFPYPEIPEGFEALDKKGTAVKMVNVFGNTERYIYGTYDDPSDPEAVYGWYKSEGINPINGMLMIDLEDGKGRVKPNDVKQKALPKELRKGFSQNVIFTCSNGFTVTGKTAYPEIDYASLKDEIIQEQKTKTGTFTEKVQEEIPYETKVQNNKALYVTEENILQHGENGIREIAYRVTYKDGVEVRRAKDTTKTIKKPVTEIIERGTKQPDEAYVFMNNVNLSASVSTPYLTEGDTLKAGCELNIIGKKPANGFNVSLDVYDPNGNQVGHKSAKNAKPDGISVSNVSAGTYRVVAEASTPEGDVVRSSMMVTVNKKADDVQANTEGIYIDAFGVFPDEPTDYMYFPDAELAVLNPVHIPLIWTETITDNQEIAFETEYYDDPEMFVDAAEVTTREGITGKRVFTYEVTYTDGIETDRQFLSETVAIQPVSRQIRRGTKQHVTETKTVTVSEAIPVENDYLDDDTRYTDDPQEVISNGSAGERTLTYQVTYLDGSEVGRELVSEAVTREMVRGCVKRGTLVHNYTYEEFQVTETIPYPVKEIWADDLEVGEDVYAQDGVDGEKVVTYRITYTDGQETKREVVSEQVTKEPVGDTHYIGTYVPTYEYTVVYATLPGTHGVRSGSLDAVCEAHAMTMAQSHSVFHSGNGTFESVGGWDTLEGAEAGLVAHVPGLVTREFWGVGIVKVTKRWANGTYSDHFYACAEGDGRILDQDENGWYAGEVWTWNEDGEWVCVNEMKRY